MTNKIFSKKKFKRWLSPFLIIVLVFGTIIFVGIKKYIPERIEEWKIYKNSQLGCELSYPASWYVKEKYPPNREQTNTKNIQWSKTVSLGELRIENIKEEVVVYGGGFTPETKRGSSFVVLVYEVTSDISSIEDWILLEKKYTYDDEPKKFTPLEIAKGLKKEYEQQEEVRLKRRDERIQKNLNAVKEKEFGDIKVKAWEGYGWNYNPDWKIQLYLIYGVDFIHEEKFYRIRYQSGSQEQLKKDLGTFEKMLASFKIK